MARRHAPVRNGAPKRLTSWFFLDASATTMTAVGGTIIVSLNAAALAVRPFTIVRTHIAWQLASDQAAAIETQVAALGGCVVSDQANAIGVTAVPTPITDLGSDLWFFHQMMYGDESQLTDRTRPAIRGFIDSKAMRKVNDSEDFLIIGETNAGVIGGGVILNIAGCILIKHS